MENSKIQSAGLQEEQRDLPFPRAALSSEAKLLHDFKLLAHDILSPASGLKMMIFIYSNMLPADVQKHMLHASESVLRIATEMRDLLRYIED